MNASITATPISPATTAALSESSPAVGDTVSTRCCSTCTGKAPRLSTRARLLASLSSNEPEIETFSSNTGSLTLGADWMVSSSTIAKRRLGQVAPWLKHSVASAFHAASPSPRSDTLTFQAPTLSSPTWALPRSKISPVPPDGPTTQTSSPLIDSSTSWPLVSGASVVVGAGGPTSGGSVTTGTVVAGAALTGTVVAAVVGTVVAGLANPRRRPAPLADSPAPLLLTAVLAGVVPGVLADVVAGVVEIEAPGTVVA